MDSTNKSYNLFEHAYASRASISTGASQHRGLPRWREMIKLHLRACWHWRSTQAWLQTINSRPMLRLLAWAQPRLIGKIYRPYLTNALSPEGRVAVLQAHYNMIERQGLEQLVLTASGKPIELVTMTGRSGTRYRVALRSVNPMEREGELVLELLCENTLVYSSAFTFFQDGHRMAVGVGGMQGAKGSNGLSIMRTATRELHGLRPKNLMIKLISALGHELGCESIRLVGNDNRAVNRSRRQGKVHADYDAFWRECGATSRPDGDFHLDCTPGTRPDFGAIESSKRAQARRRYEMVNLMTCVALSAFCFYKDK